jgi:hypothetical protein
MREMMFEENLVKLITVAKAFPFPLALLLEGRQDVKSALTPLDLTM